MTAEHVEQTIETLPERGATYVDCTIEGVAAEEAGLRSTTFEGCTFTACTLRLADLTDTRLSECTFVSCDLLGIDLTRARWGQFGLGEALRFVDCRLDYANLHGLRLDGTVLYGCSLIEADLGEAILRDADLRHADLTSTRFNGADLSRADLSGASGYRIDPAHTRLTDTRVSLPDAGAILELLGMTVTTIGERLSPEERLEHP